MVPDISTVDLLFLPTDFGSDFRRSGFERDSAISASWATFDAGVCGRSDGSAISLRHHPALRFASGDCVDGATDVMSARRVLLLYSAPGQPQASGCNVSAVWHLCTNKLALPRFSRSTSMMTSVMNSHRTPARLGVRHCGVPCLRRPSSICALPSFEAVVLPCGFRDAPVTHQYRSSTTLCEPRFRQCLVCNV